MGKAQVIYCWFVRDVTVAMLVEASLSSGIHVNSIVSTSNMAALSRGCKPRIRVIDIDQACSVKTTTHWQSISTRTISSRLDLKLSQ